MRIPIGPLLNFEDGLNPRTGSAFSARLSSIAPMDFMHYLQFVNFMNIMARKIKWKLFPCMHGNLMSSRMNATVASVLVD